MSYDAIVVGGGHNGLVAGFYLARAGLRTIILERRDIVGGACVTEEFAPGYRASTGAYVLSMLRESVWRDMRLVQRGIRVDAAGPTLNVFPDGAHYTVGDDTDQTLEETRRFSRRDADALVRFNEDLGRFAGAVIPYRPTHAFGAHTIFVSSCAQAGSRCDTAAICWIWRSCSPRPRRSSWRSGSSPTT